MTFHPSFHRPYIQSLNSFNIPSTHSLTHSFSSNQIIEEGTGSEELVAELDQLANAANALPEPGTLIPLAGALDINNLLPTNSNYYSYLGSLTSPGCGEVVTWTVMRQTVGIYQRHVESFRSLLDDDGIPLIKNARPLQHLKGRRLLKSF